MHDQAILILEDDAVLRKQLARFLERRGFAVTATASIREFLQRVRADEFAAVLLDLSLPDGDGIDAWALGRRYQPQATALLMTAQTNPAVAARARAGGFVAVLGKPLRVPQLLGLVCSAAVAA